MKGVCKLLGLAASLVTLTACQTFSTYEGDEAHLSGEGLARYHVYRGVNKCRTAFGLDPAAFDMMVTAASSRIVKQVPNMHKVGSRQGPYEHAARCMEVRAPSTKKSVVVRIIDICCGGKLDNPKSHQLDLSEQAFARLAPKSKGLIRVEWDVVDCPSHLQVKSDEALCNDDYYFQGRRSS